MITSTVKMLHMSLTLMRDDATLAANVLADLEAVHLIESQQDNSLLNEQPAVEYQQAYQALNSRYQKIIHYRSTTKPAPLIVSEKYHPTLTELNHAVEQARDIWLKISFEEEKLRSLKDRINQTRQLRNNLERFRHLDIDLNDLHRDSRFIKVFIGTVPVSGHEQLKRALSLTHAVVETFQTDESLRYITVAAPRDQQHEIEDILKSADFHELEIPPELHDHPDRIDADINQQMQAFEVQQLQLTTAITTVIEQHSEQLDHMKMLLEGGQAFAAISGSLSGKGELVHLQGWIPAKRESDISTALDTSLKHPYLMETRKPRYEEYAEVPFVEQRIKWLKPFYALVGQYGTPRYSEIDPARFFAVSYILMFGMMFGDIGHGAAIIFIGFLLRKKINGVMTFATLAGLSSMLFGWLYGSIFGYEHIIHPVWMSPMEDPSRVLILALYWGVGFLITAYLFSIRNLVKLDMYSEALFSNKGLAGLALFCGSFYAGYAFMTKGHFGILQILAFTLPLIIILVKNWEHLDGNLAERVLLILIEALDNMINILSSTLSFLRVGAFSLNHVALAMAVFTMAGMMDTFGHTLTVILGNLIIIVLEGGIVAIQCLRLEYYEGFSRFFSGLGKPFRPLTMHSSQ